MLQSLTALVVLIVAICIPLHHMFWCVNAGNDLPTVIAAQQDANASELDDALVVVSSCVLGGRFDQIVINASLQNKLRYCALATSQFPFPTRCALFDTPTPGSHHPVWEKYIHLRDEMLHSSEAWFLWIDCDAVFSNASFSWHTSLIDIEVARRNPPRDLMLARDANGANLGVFLLSNTLWSLGYLDAMLAMQARTDAFAARELLRDQRAFNVLMRRDASFKEHVREVPQKLLNAYFSHSKGHGVVWKPGDWIAHQVDCRRPECNAELVRFASALK